MEVIKKTEYTYPVDKAKKWEELTFKPIKDLKLSLKLYDGNIIECAVFRVQKNGQIEEHTCISTQVGCKYNCEFCTSGKNGYVRNLSKDEIIEELKIIAAEEHIQKFDCILYMGIGEPLDNYDNVVGSMKEILSTHSLLADNRNLFLATNGGKLKQLRKLARLKLPLEIWVSLHASSDVKRNRIMPINKSVPIKKLVDNALYYAVTTNTPLLLNYMVFPGFNDTDEDIRNLKKILNGKVGKINLILTEPNCDLIDFKKATLEQIVSFEKRLKDSGIKNKINRFVTAGNNLEAGCGEFTFTKA